MKVDISSEKLKDLLRELLVEMIRENREGFYELLKDVIEEVGLANAISEGRKNELVPEERILKLLDG